MTKQFVVSLFISAVFCCRASVTSANANLVWNGDFENGTFVDAGGESPEDNLPNDWSLGPPSPSSLSKVNVVNTVSSPLGPESGSDYLRYQSTSSNGSEDCIWQNIPTIAGQKYIFSYWVDDTSTSAGNNVAFDAVWDENTANADYHVLNTSGITGPTGYKMFSFTETASTTSTRIDFHAVDTNGSILLDNTSVVAVPEPATISLVAAGLVVAGLRRRPRGRA